MNAPARLDALAAAHPEWSAWLRVVREVAGELASPAWAHELPPMASAGDGRPLLAGAALRPDGQALARLFHRLCVTARAQALAQLAGDDPAPGPMPPADALALFAAAVDRDTAALDAWARRRGAAPEGFATLAELLPMPYLHACARAAAAAPGLDAAQGHCPVCGSWPAFAEVPGVEPARLLRCGRCGAGWPMPAPACPYCGTTDHRQLGTLVHEDRRSRFAVEVCRVCGGYLKSCTTLQATPADEVLATDLASVEYDLVALERGFRRPPQPALPLHATLAAAAPPGFR